MGTSFKSCLTCKTSLQQHLLLGRQHCKKLAIVERSATLHELKVSIVQMAGTNYVCPELTSAGRLASHTPCHRPIEEVADYDNACFAALYRRIQSGQLVCIELPLCLAVLRHHICFVTRDHAHAEG